MSLFESQIQDDENHSRSWESTDFQWKVGGKSIMPYLTLLCGGWSQPSHQWRRSMNDDRGNRAILGQQVRALENPEVPHSTLKYLKVPHST